MRILRHCSDWRSIVAVLITLCLLAGAWILEPSGALAVAVVFISSFFCFVSCVINHNHIHSSTFHSPFLNSVYEIFLSIARGHSAQTVYLPHNINHHSVNGGEGDWISPTHVNHQLDWIAAVRYTLKSILTMNLERRKKENKLQMPYARRQSFQALVIWVTFFTLLTLKPLPTIIFIGLPWFIGAFMLVGVNLYQHAQCDPENPYGSSRNFISSIENFLFFNNGFHTVHHLAPGAHWSKLPAMHAQIADKIPRDLNQRSFFLFLFRHAWPQRRA